MGKVTSDTELIERLRTPKLRGSMSPEIHAAVNAMADTMDEAARVISTLTAEVEELRAKFASFASHATGGRTTDISLPLNTLSVVATQKVNDAWNAALEKGREEARATLTAEVEGLKLALMRKIQSGSYCDDVVCAEPNSSNCICRQEFNYAIERAALKGEGDKLP